jgi:hypothetical protein
MDPVSSHWRTAHTIHTSFRSSYPLLDMDGPRVCQSCKIGLVLPHVCRVNLTNVVITYKRGRHFGDLHRRDVTAWTCHVSGGELFSLASTHRWVSRQLTTNQFFSSSFVFSDIQRSGFHRWASAPQISFDECTTLEGVSLPRNRLVDPRTYCEETLRIVPS